MKSPYSLEKEQADMRERWKEQREREEELELLKDINRKVSNGDFLPSDLE